MAASSVYENVDAIPPLHKCKACLRVLNEAVKLACGHRVCGDPCLNELCANLPVAQCPVTSCDVVIDPDAVTDDDVIRKAVCKKVATCCPYTQNGCTRILSRKALQVNQNDCRFRTNENCSDLQASNNNFSIDTEDSMFQEDDVKQLSEKDKNNYKRCMMTMARTEEAAIAQQRRAEEQHQQQDMAISRNTTDIASNTRLIQELQQHNHRQQRVVCRRTGYRPTSADIGVQTD